MLKELYGTTFTISDLFDFEFYKQKFKKAPFELESDGFAHYNTQGWRDGLSPSRLFDTLYYLQSNPDVQKAGNPLVHYVKHGQFEGRLRLPTAAVTEVLSPIGMTVYDKLKDYADRAFYFEQSGHQLDCGVDVLMHYFAYGYRSGLRIAPGFDPAFYLENNGDVARNRQDPLVHYARFGWRELRRSAADATLVPLPTCDVEAIGLIRRHMDADYYRAKLPWIGETDIDAAAHYFYFGEKSGFDPSSDFSAAHYLQTNLDVREAGVSAYYHYLTSGQSEGRLGTPTGYPALRPAPLTVADFEGLDVCPGYMRFADSQAPYAYVILPVYRGYSETLGALRSALTAHNTTPFKILVLDDHSPDATLTADLATLCARYGAGYAYNTENLGFVANVNRGLAKVEAQGAAHVILLNADTIVYEGWIDRMRAHLERDPTIATITPMSNNATIMSYPRFCSDNRFEFEMPHAELARMASQVELAPVDVITGVGFAMLISREALKRVGRLDEAAFGKGYGEEVDFCQRAALEGMRNIAAPDVFVTHFGSVSFLDTQKKENAEGQQVLNARYPGYETAVFDFIHGDPMQPIRQAYDIKRLIRLCRQHPFIISVSHSKGGGIQSYVGQMSRIACDSGFGFLDISIVNGAYVAIRPEFPGTVAAFDNLEAVPITAFVGLMDELADACRWFLFNSMIGAATRLRLILRDLLLRQAEKLVYVLHDYSVYCPRANFTHVTQTYCDGIQPVEKCQACVRTLPSTPDIDIIEWRETHYALMTASKRVISPNPVVPQYLWDQLDLTNIVRPHWEPDIKGIRPLNRQFPASNGDKLVFAVLGAIGPHKGSRILRALKAYINRHNVDMEIHLIGYCDLQDLPDNKTIFVHGAYANNAEAIAQLHKIRPNAVLSLSVWPETYCYALSIPLALGLPVIALDIGAQGERVAAYSRGALLDFALRNDIPQLVTEILTVDLDALWRTPLKTGDQRAYKDLNDYLAVPE